MSSFANNYAPTSGDQTWIYLFDHECNLAGWANGLIAGSYAISSWLPGQFEVAIGDDNSSPNNIDFVSLLSWSSGLIGRKLILNT